MLAFDFLPEIPMDKSHTLEQLTGRFQTVKDGIPELVKNAKDQYARLGVTERDHRQIIVILNSRKQALAVLDFAGARSSDFDGWKTWSSRTASQHELAQDIEGGHGNGGKAFMVRGSTATSYMDSCANGLRTRMGFDNKEPRHRYLPGYGRSDHVRLCDLKESDPRGRLDEALKEMGPIFDDLPQPARKAFEKRQSFTLVRVDGVRDWASRRRDSVLRLVGEVPVNMVNHAQAALTIETCCVWVIGDKKLLTKQPLAPSYPEPMSGFADLPLIPVPAELKDPEDGELVSTGPGSTKEKYLRLRTSKKALRMSDDLKALNVIRVRNDRNIVANWPVAGLAPRAESSFVLGELRVPEIKGEHLADSHRTDLADTPLRRALWEWVSEQISTLSDQIAKAQAKETKAEDQAKASATLQQFRELMREFLETERTPLEENVDGEGPEGPEGRRPKRKGRRGSLGSTVNEILLEPGRDRIALAVGTTVPLVFRCYEVDDDGDRHPVVGAGLELGAAQKVVSVDCRRGVMTAQREGKTQIWLRDRASGVTSNRLTVDALTCAGVDVVAPTEPLLQGQRIQLLVSFHTSAGPRDDLLVDGAIDEQDLGRISRTGYFTAGLAQGTATVRVRYGPLRGDMGVAHVNIGSEVMPPSGRGGEGTDIPLILLCGEEAPGMDEYPQDQRTLHGGEYYPTIIEEPQFPQVVWINPGSKESLRVRRGRGGPAGTAGVGTKTFLQFVALKCFDILKRLRVRQVLGGASVTEREFTREFAQAEVDCAAFVDSAYEIAEGLTQANGVTQ